MTEAVTERDMRNGGPPASICRVLRVPPPVSYFRPTRLSTSLRATSMKLGAYFAHS